ncbi:hypothetical protein EIP86_000885 [Pleurotus ostreatoroseus]|nr:hypothetical protein EIP86_000885 [Pleurotus ostreatoroseus]
METSSYYGLLRARIDIFNSLDIQDQADGSASREGSDDQHPIRPPQVTKVQWEHLLTLFYKNLGPPPYPVAFLVSVLKLASQWGMPESKEWAISHLQRMIDVDDINSCLEFRLGIQYQQQGWVRDAAKEIMMSPLSDISSDRASLLGFPAFQAIMRARESLLCQWSEAICDRIEVTAPIHESCSNPKNCALLWRLNWAEDAAKYALHCRSGVIIHPEYELMSSKPVGMHGACYNLARNRFTLANETQAIKREVLDELMETLNNIPFESIDLTIASSIEPEDSA